MKILHVVFSCNRLKYLTKTLESWDKLDYGDHEVTRLIIDDYPRTRNDGIFQLLAKTHNTLLWLHDQNYGLSVTWSQFFDYLKSTDYDYVLHQEDDVVLLESVKVDDLIHVLESDSKMASVVLQRQPWYYYESESKIEPEDVKIANYYVYKNTKTFPIIFSLYRKSIIDYPMREYWGFNMNEGMAMVYLEYFHQMYAGMVKNSEGRHIIEHIGNESTGKRILSNEPRYEFFAHMDPDKMYCSRTGVLIE